MDERDEYSRTVKKKYHRLARLAREFPGLIRISDFPASEHASVIDGLLMNLPSLEAAEDLRGVMAIGACFGGDDGKKYLEHLQDLAYADDPSAAESSKEMMREADQKRSNMMRGPNG